MATPEQRKQLGQRGRMCRQSYKATLFGFIGSVRSTHRYTHLLTCLLKWLFDIRQSFRQRPFTVAVENVHHNLVQYAEISWCPHRQCQLLINNMGFHFQVTRARRQVKTDPPKRGKSGRSGAFSVLVSLHVCVYSPTHKRTAFDEYLHDVALCSPGRSTERRTERQTREERTGGACCKIKCSFSLRQSLRNGVHGTNVSTFYQKHM